MKAWSPLLIGLSLTAWPCTDAQANLVFNPGFETPGNTPLEPFGWEVFVLGGSGSRLTITPHTGRAFVRLSGDPAEGANFAVLVQRQLPVDPGTPYQMEFFAKADAVDGPVGFRTEFYDVDDRLIGGQFDNNVFINDELTAAYQPFDSVFTAPQDATTATIVLFWERLDGLTTVDFDDVAFFQIPEPSSLMLMGAMGALLVRRSGDHGSA